MSNTIQNISTIANRSSPMDRLKSLQLFTRIVELKSFSKAANVMEIPRATVTHAIRELEEQLGARLLERTTRAVRPTIDGQVFYERCLHILSELDDAESSLRNDVKNPKGTLRVEMHGTHATHIVLPRIQEFHRRYPDIQLMVSSGDRLVDLLQEGVDCVIRGGTPKDSSLVAKRLALMPQIICASPEYFAKYGKPTQPHELADHKAINFFTSNTGISYPFELYVNGELEEFSLDGWISVSNAEDYVVAALSGCGLIQLPRFHVDDDLAHGRLVSVLDEWKSPALTLNIMYPFHRQLSPRLRVFIDWVAMIYTEKFEEKIQ